jgi:hypothetical protein
MRLNQPPQALVELLLLLLLLLLLVVVVVPPLALAELVDAELEAVP